MKLNYYIYSLIAGVLLMFSACTPDEYEMGSKAFAPEDLVEGVAYSVTHDANNPNIVYLKSLLGPEYTPLWEHPQGRSQEAEVTLKMPFEGTYEVTFGVETRGGVVYGAPTTFTIDDFCADFVTGEMWDFLAGGSGNSKTWIPDNGSYGLQQGFYTCFDPSTTYVDMVQNGSKWTTSSKTWWEPSNADAGVTEDDLMASMTFSLQGSAGLSVTTYKDGVATTKEGMFSMNTDNHTISAIDVDFAHGAWADGKAVDFRNNFQILVLTENQLMIGNYRDEAMSGEGRCVYCWNFVSKEYADNYVPVDQPDPEPALPDGWKDAVSEISTTKIVWNMSPDVPFDWANLDGSLMNNFTAGNYPDWATPQANLDKLTMTLDSKDNSYEFVMPDGTTVSGTYELDDKGIYTFSAGVPSYHIGGGDIMFAATAENQLRILQVNMLGDVLQGMWLGQRSTEKDEYIAYHFVPAAGSSSSEPEYTTIAVDNSKIVWGDLEGKGNFRVELYNIWGATGAGSDSAPEFTENSPFDPNSILFTSQMQLTFTISGLTGAAATNEYVAQLMCTSPGWWPSIDSEKSPVEIPITGNGTYTFTYNAPAAYDKGVIVFCIDILNMFNDIDDPDAVSVTIDSLRVI